MAWYWYVEIEVGPCKCVCFLKHSFTCSWRVSGGTGERSSDGRMMLKGGVWAWESSKRKRQIYFHLEPEEMRHYAPIKAWGKRELPRLISHDCQRIDIKWSLTSRNVIDVRRRFWRQETLTSICVDVFIFCHNTFLWLKSLWWYGEF